MSDQPPSLREQIANKCRHFNGIPNVTCRAGVVYDEVRGPTPGFFPLPCFKSDGCTDRCALASFLTPEEVEAKAQDMETAAVTFLTEMAEGKTCVHCHAPIESKKQVGRSVYALPCWHRQYQGKLSKKEGGAA